MRSVSFSPYFLRSFGSVSWRCELFTDRGADGVVGECSVLYQFHRAQFVLKAVVLALDGKVHGAAFIRLHGWIKFVDSVVKFLVVFADGGSGTSMSVM